MRIRQRFDHISSNSIQFFFFFVICTLPQSELREAQKKKDPLLPYRTSLCLLLLVFSIPASNTLVCHSCLFSHAFERSSSALLSNMFGSRLTSGMDTAGPYISIIRHLPLCLAHVSHIHTGHPPVPV